MKNTVNLLEQMGLFKERLTASYSTQSSMWRSAIRWLPVSLKQLLLNMFTIRSIMRSEALVLLIQDIWPHSHTLPLIPFCEFLDHHTFVRISRLINRWTAIFITQTQTVWLQCSKLWTPTRSWHQISRAKAALQLLLAIPSRRQPHWSRFIWRMGKLLSLQPLQGILRTSDILTLNWKM